jgi:D-serine deaminase-like pyridoxal phosphate-dependent protein
MALNYKLILAPSESVKKMLIRRMAFGRGTADVPALKTIGWGAVLLVQGPIPDIFYAADLGAKISPVFVEELVGNCPQNIISMAFIGNVADVKQVLAALVNEGVVAG